MWRRVDTLKIVSLLPSCHSSNHQQTVVQEQEWSRCHSCSICRNWNSYRNPHLGYNCCKHLCVFANLGSRCVETSEQSDGLQSLKSEAKKVNKTQVQDVSTTSGAIWWVGVGSCDISHNCNNYITMIISHIAYTHNCHGWGFQQQRLSGWKWTL